MKKYASIQNRVLVDYKKFRDSIVQQIKLLRKGANDINTQLDTKNHSNSLYQTIQPKRSKEDKPRNKSSTPAEAEQDLHNRGLNNSALDLHRSNNQSVLLPRQDSQIRAQPSHLASTLSESEHQLKLRSKLASAAGGDRTNKMTVSNLLDQQNYQLNQTLKIEQEKKKSALISEDDSLRPRTRQESNSFFNSNRRGSSSEYTNQKRKIIKQQLLNRTLTAHENASLLSSHSSQTPDRQIGSRNQTRNFSSTLEAGRLLPQGNTDYLDYHHSSKNQHETAHTLENRILLDSMKRAQTSHGNFGSRVNKGSILIQPKSSQLNNQTSSNVNSSGQASRLGGMGAEDTGARSSCGINNLLHNLRQQRKQGASGLKPKRDKSQVDQRDYSALNSFLTQALNTQSDVNLDYQSVKLPSSNKKTASSFGQKQQHYHSLQQSKHMLEQLNTLNNMATASTQHQSNILVPLAESKLLLSQKAKNDNSILDPLNMTMNKTSNEILLNQNSQSLYQTFNTSTLSSSVLGKSKFKSVLKSKLSYEWKNIYRHISQCDKQCDGSVSSSDFEQALHQFNVFITKEELNKINSTYASEKEESGVMGSRIDYQQMSEDLGLHNSSLSYLKNHSLRMQNIQKLRDIYSSDHKSRLNYSSSIDHHSQDRASRGGGGSRNFNNQSIIERVKTAAEGGVRQHSLNLKNESHSAQLNAFSGHNTRMNQSNLENFRIIIEDADQNAKPFVQPRGNKGASLISKSKTFKLSKLNNTVNLGKNINAAAAALTTQSHFHSVSQDEEQNSIRDTLLSKIKQFRDLVQASQKRNQLVSSATSEEEQQTLVKLNEFKVILQSLGINITQKELQRFLVKGSGADGNGLRKNGEDIRSKSSSGFYSQADKSSTQLIDAKEFLKFYI